MTAQELRKAINWYLGRDSKSEVKLSATGDVIIISEWNAVEAQPTIQQLQTTYDDNILDDIKTKKKNQIKSSANSFIISQYPDWKQRNYTQKKAKFAMKKHDSALTLVEENLENEIDTAWDWIDNVRDQSDTFEDEVDALSTVEDVNNYTWSFT